MPQTRQLAAIMFADIMGYTATMEDDEVLALQMREKLKHQLEAAMAIHGGRIIKFSGDGALCSFDSAIKSVRVAIAVQLSMLVELKVPLRIGIHQSDIIFEEADVHGDGVNVASRLESLAVPGSIFVSAKVHDDIKNQKDIQTVSLGKYLLKNVKEPVEIFAVSNPGLQVPLHQKLEGKAQKFVERKSVKSRKKLLFRVGLILILLAVTGFLFVIPWTKKTYARNTIVPRIQELITDYTRPSTVAFDLAMEAEKYIPEDSSLIKIWKFVSSTVSIETEPSGAEVFWKDYSKPDSAWRSAGITPLQNIKLPRGYLRIEIRKNGYQTIEFAGPQLYTRLGPEIAKLKLDKVGTLPENMARIPKSRTNMSVVGLEQEGPRQVCEFLIDKYEVTNSQFKAFTNAGGYSNKSYWKYPIYHNGKEIPLQTAWTLFVDKTGRQGPATWEAGTFPDGQENYPVTGVSWYEAAAYAAFAKKQLPTIFQWAVVAETSRTESIVPLSNFNGKSTTPVGSMPGYNTFGIYDLAGNAREWCFNERGPEARHQRYILGGGWNDPTYAFNDSYSQLALDRSVGNGFRCIKELPNDSLISRLSVPVTMAFRDYSKENPVDDKTFAIFLKQFNYDKTPLNPTAEPYFENEIFKVEKITIDAGYNGERMDAYLFLPKGFKPPYQTIVFVPGSYVFHANKFDTETLGLVPDFILKNGRALLYPIYKGTFQRNDGLNSDLQNETVFYKDHVIMWRKDIGRGIDYLETRKDIQFDKIGFFGFSWGGFIGGLIPAIEKRIKVVALNVGGMQMTKALPEVDQINFLPRVIQPVLMLNGKHDMFFPVETSQKYMFNFLGTPKEDKKTIIYESGHLVPRTDLVKESLAWFDKYLGKVEP